MKRLSPKAEGRRPNIEVARLDPTKPAHPQLRIFAPGVRASVFLRVNGYMLTEALVYIGLVFLLLGIGSAALYRCIDNSVALRRNADDMTRVLHAGELWRADVRGSTRGVHLDTRLGESLLRLERSQGEVDYRYADGAVYRRIGSGPWSRILDRVQSSAMAPDPRGTVTAWRWELELQAYAKGSFKPGRVRPLFTFLAVPSANVAP